MKEEKNVIETEVGKLFAIDKIEFKHNPFSAIIDARFVKNSKINRKRLFLSNEYAEDFLTGVEDEFKTHFLKYANIKDVL